MSENLLVDALSGVISVEDLKEWICKESERLDNEIGAKYECNNGEFVSYFLNFVHEKAIIIHKYGETPQKIHTPRSIRKQEIKTIEQRQVKRRAPLFSEICSTSQKSNIEVSFTSQSANFHQQQLNLNKNSPSTTLHYIIGQNTSMHSSNSFISNNDINTPNKSTKSEILTSTPKTHRYQSESNLTNSFSNTKDFSNNRSILTHNKSQNTSNLNHSNSGYMNYGHNSNTSNKNTSHMSNRCHNSTNQNYLNNSSPIHNRISSFNSPHNTPKHNPWNKSGSFHNSSHDRSSPGISLGDCIVVKKTSGKKKSQKSCEKTSESGSKADDTENKLNITGNKSNTENKLLTLEKSLTAVESYNKKKRINPTDGNRKHPINLQTSKNSFNFQLVQELSPENKSETDQRNLLAEEILTRNKSAPEIKLSPKKIKLSMIQQNRFEINPDLSCVSNRIPLNVAVDLYSFLLHKNLVLNITGEIHFLLTLLLSKNYEINSTNVCSTKVADILEDELLTDDDQTVQDVKSKELKDFEILRETEEVRATEKLSDTEKIRPSEKISDNEKIQCDSNDTDDAKLQTTKLTDSDPKNGFLEVFDSVHNTTYFAANVLSNIFNLLDYLDGTTLGLLVNNERFKKFVKNIPEVSFIPRQKSDSFLLGVLNDGVRANVCFNSDTDNRDNFPSEPSFHAFRKQRDLFYEILMHWEQNHMNRDWNFAKFLGGKVKSLLTVNAEASNYRHLAKLFKGQLLGSCMKSSVKEQGLTEQQLPFLSDVPNLNVEKLQRLKSRLVTKQLSNGINAPPAFHGVQEFYKDFIYNASNYGFNEHLKDTFTVEIVELNDSKFESSEFDEADTSVDSSTKEKFIMCTKSLRILAKFLGLIESLPYKFETQISEKVLCAELQARKFNRPHLDLHSALIQALEKGSLVLAVPWIVEYLAMLDYVTIRLPYYTSLLETLFAIYSSNEYTSDITSTSTLTKTLINLSLGWLFELPHFPSEHYYEFLSTKIVKKLSCDLTSSHRNTENKLDNLDMVDSKVLYLCCPYVEEIKKLLHSNNANKHVKIKHITPLTASESPTEATEKRLRSQMEEGFFNSQPISVKKTVDFVCERVASACVKRICNKIVPEYKKLAVQEFQSFLTTVPLNEASRSQFCNQLNKKGLEYAELHLKLLKTSCINLTEKMATDRVNGSIHNLMALDDLDYVKEVCCFIAKRLCLQRVNQWINSHVKISIFTKEIDFEVQKFVTSQGKYLKEKPTFHLPPGGRLLFNEHREGALDSFQLVEKLRNYTVDLESNTCNKENSNSKDDVYCNELADIIRHLIHSYERRCDINDAITSTMNRMLFDATLMTIAKKPQFIHNGIKFTETLGCELTDLWKKYEKDCDDLVKSVLCPRNCLMMMQSLTLEPSWKAYSDFVGVLMKQGILTSNSLELQCLSLYKKDWDDVTLSYISLFLRRLFETQHSQDEQLIFLVGFLSDYCSDL